MAEAVTKRYGSVKRARAAMKGGSGSGAIFRLKADETLKVRFLQEPDDWHEAYHHYIDQKFYWCSRRNCEHCDGGNRPRKAALANVVIMASPRDGDVGRVVVMQMPPSLADQVLKRHEKFGTILDRDYDLSREGSGLNDTKYSVDYDDRKRRDLSRWDDKIHDITAIVSADLVSSGGGTSGDDDEEPRSTKKSSRRSSHEDEDEDDYEDDEDEDSEEDEDEFAELDRSELKREIKKLDPDFVAKKSQSDEDLREILRDLASSEDSEEEDDEEEDERPRGSSKKSKYDGLNEFKAKPAAKKTTVRAVRRSR